MLLLRKVLATETIREELSHQMNGHTQINIKKSNLLYRRPANKNESHSSMTKKVHDTHLKRLVFLDLKK